MWTSVRPLCYLLLNQWTKFNQIWCLSYSHEWGAHSKKKFWVSPPGEGSKGQISFNFNYKVNFKDFLFQTLCVFSQMKDTKNIRWVFYSVAWFMPYGGTWGNFNRSQNQITSCCLSDMLSPPKPLDEIQPNLVCELLT